MDKLYIVIPAYNEEDNIENVVREWHDVIVKINEESRLIVFDDGSKDKTYSKLMELKNELPQLEAVSKTNSGHGATVLYGYNYALQNSAEYIFQTDSDGQTIADEFWQLWESRKKYDVQIGYRKDRKDGLGRVFVTKTLKLILFLCFGLWITDANTPFRLMSYNVLNSLLPQIPKDYNLSNVLLTVLIEKTKVKLRYVKITFRPRQAGVNSINMRRIWGIGRQAVKDFLTLNKIYKNI